MELVLFPDHRLRTRCKPVKQITAELRQTLDDMMQKMEEWGGIGLAAPQCGVMLQMFVMHIPGHGRYAFVNPSITDLGEGLSTMDEGCLSLPGASIEVTRPSSVRLEAIGYDGEKVDLRLIGMESVCAQHENDHLSGTLIIDKTDSMHRRMAAMDVWNAGHPRH